MIKDLIFDIGCNNGDDTDFYLRKGFRVVSVDADESLCKKVRERFAAEVEAKRCAVIRGAVALSSEGFVTFYVCDQMTDWNTCDLNFVKRNTADRAVTYRETNVPCVSIGDLMNQYGTPYYLKIDIEGADTIPLKTMGGRADRPTYVSIEVAQHDLSLALEQLALLSQLGYGRFQFFNQGMRKHLKAPRPPKEGGYAEYYPHAVTTGLFGRELPGQWLDLPGALHKLTGICGRYALFHTNKWFSKNGGMGGTLISKVYNRYRRHLLGDPVT